MQGSHTSPPEVLIAIRRFSADAPGFVAAARRVARGCMDTTMAIDAYHRTRDDIALMRVHFASGTPPWQVASLIVQVMSEGMEAIETARMTAGRWRWYVHNRLPTFTHMAHAASLDAAVGMMAERVEPSPRRRRLAAGTIIHARPPSVETPIGLRRQRATTMRDSETTPVCAGEVDTARFDKPEGER